MFRSPGRCGSPDRDSTRLPSRDSRHRRSFLPDCPQGTISGTGRASRGPNPGSGGKPADCPRSAIANPAFLLGVLWGKLRRGQSQFSCSSRVRIPPVKPCRAWPVPASCNTRASSCRSMSGRWSRHEGADGQGECSAVERDRGPVSFVITRVSTRKRAKAGARVPLPGAFRLAPDGRRARPGDEPCLAVHFHSKSEQWPGRQHQLDEG